MYSAEEDFFYDVEGNQVPQPKYIQIQEQMYVFDDDMLLYLIMEQLGAGENPQAEPREQGQQQEPREQGQQQEEGQEEGPEEGQEEGPEDEHAQAPARLVPASEESVSQLIEQKISDYQNQLFQTPNQVSTFREENGEKLCVPGPNEEGAATSQHTSNLKLSSYLMESSGDKPQSSERGAGCSQKAALSEQQSSAKQSSPKQSSAKQNAAELTELSKKSNSLLHTELRSKEDRLAQNDLDDLRLSISDKMTSGGNDASGSQKKLVQQSPFLPSREKSAERRAEQLSSGEDASGGNDAYNFIQRQPQNQHATQQQVSASQAEAGQLSCDVQRREV